MAYTPTFVCEFCKKDIPVAINGNQGAMGVCGCPESMKEWERQHRAEIERRKQVRRRTR